MEFLNVKPSPKRQLKSKKFFNICLRTTSTYLAHHYQDQPGSVFYIEPVPLQRQVKETELQRSLVREALCLWCQAFCLSAGQSRDKLLPGGQTDLYFIELSMMRLQNNLSCQAYYHPVLH